MGGAILGQGLAQGPMRAFVRQFEGPMMKALAEGFERASTAQDAKSLGRDLEKTFKGQMPPQQFGYNFGMTLVGGGLGKVVGYPFGGGNLSSLVNTATSFGFGLYQQQPPKA